MIIFDSIQAVAITLVCYLLFLSLFYALRYLKKSNENKIKKYTFEFCVNDNKDYSAILSNVFSKDLNKKSHIIDSDLFTVLSFFEKISIGVKNEIFDEKIIGDYYARYFFVYHRIAKHYLLEYRNNNNDPFVFIEFEKLTKKWRNNSELGVYDV